MPLDARGKSAPGASADDTQPGLFRREHGRHVIFYAVQSGGIFVVRVLHQSMDAERHVDQAKKDEP